MTEGAKNNLLNTYLPIGAVVTAVVVIVGFVVWLNTIATRGEATAATVTDVQETIKDYPNRREFENLQGDVREIKADVKSILQKK